MKAKVTIKKVDKYGYMIFNAESSVWIGKITIDVLGDYTFEAFNCVRMHLCRLECLAELKGFFTRKFRDLGIEEVEFDDKEFLNETEKDAEVDRWKMCKNPSYGQR